MSTTMLMWDCEESHAKEPHGEEMGAGDHVTASDKESIMSIVTYVRPNEALLRYWLKDCVIRYMKWHWVIRSLSIQVEISKLKFTPSELYGTVKVRPKSAPIIEIKPKRPTPKKIFIGKLRKHLLVKAKYAELPEKRKLLMKNDQAAKIVNEFEKPITKLYKDICCDKTLSAKEKKKQIKKLKKSEPFVNRVAKSQENITKEVDKKLKSEKTFEFWKKTLNDLMDSTTDEKKKTKRIQEIIEKQPGVYRCVKISREVKDQLLQEKQYCQKVSIDEYEKNKMINTATALRDQLVHVLESKTMTNIEKTNYTRRFAEVHPPKFREICGTLPSSDVLSSPLKKQKSVFFSRFRIPKHFNLFKKSSETSKRELTTELVDSESS